MVLALWLAACASGPQPSADHIKAPPPTRAEPILAQPPTWQDLAPGLQLRRWSPWPQTQLHVLRLDLAAPGLRLRLTPETERGRTLDAFSGAREALISLNASFFDREFSPRGLTLSEGQPWASVMAAQRESSPLLACDAAQRCEILLQGHAAYRPDWQLVVAGTPWLVDAGRARSPADDAACAAFCARPHPRSALGLEADGRHLLIVLAEGRRPPVLGLSLSRLAQTLQALGAVQAFNLDGGGSTAWLLRGELAMARPLNEPALRPLANALQLLERAPR
ncbi:uncharacterized protein DUF2233 [Roseateles asaccharophilus]|uniref:Uncharacterized protein DUF2233 n=1 Tax=Roseateles asaccharophilus TaxID=582607 RepID=A0A4R6N3K0_9BURK|nr:uncharacterized protein DUF2233 [Roseateles asaccharophilus]